MTKNNSEETRNQILNAALELFSRHGYDAASVKDICDAAQVSKGAFYHHFSSKQALFLQLMERWLLVIDQHIQAARLQAGDIPQAFEAMAGTTGNLYQTADGGFPIFLEFWTQANRQPEIWKNAVEPYHRYMTFFQTLIQEGIHEGSLDPSVNTEDTARIMVALAMGLLLQALLDPKGATWDEVTRMGINMLMKGLRRSQ